MVYYARNPAVLQACVHPGLPQKNLLWDILNCNIQVSFHSSKIYYIILRLNFINIRDTCRKSPSILKDLGYIRILLHEYIRIWLSYLFKLNVLKR